MPPPVEAVWIVSKAEIVLVKQNGGSPVTVDVLEDRGLSQTDAGLFSIFSL